MSQSKIRTRILTSAGALMLWPALALAQSGSASSPSQGTSPSQGAQGQSPAESSQTAPAMDESDSPQGNVESSEMSRRTQQGSMTSQTQGSMPNAPAGASIDPAQIQKVFGSEVSLIELASLSNEDVKTLQQQLQERGHYRGNIDGIVGPKTRAGLTALLAQQYSLEQRLVNQGQITNEIASALGVDAQGRTPVSGIDMGDLPSQQPQQRPNVQSFPAPSNGQQQPGTPPQTDRQGTRPAAPSTPPATPPGDSRTDDGQMDNYAPTSPR